MAPSSTGSGRSRSLSISDEPLPGPTNEARGASQSGRPDPATVSGVSSRQQQGKMTLALPDQRRVDIDLQASRQGLDTTLCDIGPALITISPSDTLVFDQAYANHAPCVHRLTICNQDAEHSVLVRMDTNLSQGLSFMRRKRSAPKNDFEPCAWPTNSLTWARRGGLSPQNLRGWRHVIANLENASSFVLNPGASTTLYVMFRPMAFTTDGEGDQLQSLAFKSPPSPAFQQTPRFERALDDSLASRTDASALTSTSPVSTPAALGEQHDPFGKEEAERNPLETGNEAILASPRSAPELCAAAKPERMVLGAKPQFSTFDVRGSITARAWSLPRAEAPFADDALVDTPFSGLSSAASSRPASFYGSVQSSTTAATSSSFSLPDEGTGQSKTMLVSARCCRPSIDAILHSSEITSTSGNSLIEIDFGDALVGQAYNRTLVLRNNSEIDCICQATMEEARNMLQARPITLLSADDGSPLPMVSADDDSVTHDPFGLLPRTTRAVELRLAPQEPCKDYEQVITFTNLHDSANAIRVVVRANILGVAKDDSLAVLSGDILDFGDCYGGHWTRQLLVLKNTADVLLDVQFGAPRGIDMTFQLAELAPQADEEAIEDEQLPPSSVASDISIPSSGDVGSHFSSALDSSSAISLDPAGGPGVGLEPSATYSELAKTPTHYAQATPAEADPPKLELSKLDPLSTPAQASGLAAQSDRSEGEDVDASSVASQQGSRPASPVDERVPTGLSAKDPRLESLTKESLATRLERLNSGPGSDDERSRPAKALSARVGSDGDHQSISTNPYSQSSSSFLSRPSSRNRLGEHKAFDAVGTDDAGSAKSEATAHSRESRMGPLPATSTSSHPGSTAGGKHPRSGLGRALSGLRNVEQAHSNQLEELVLRPGGEYRVVVSYKPAREDLDADFTGGRLVERSFNVSLDYARSRSGSTRTKGGRERKTIVCQSRTCTSFISVSPKLIDLGEVQVGTRKSANIAVTNRSELTARVDLRFVSKVLGMYKDEVAIPALQTVELKVESFPRRINESYRKQITVANLLNRHDDQIFEVRSVNVDKQRISFHSLFYRLLTPTGSNFVDFGDVNINSTRIRNFTIENTSGAKLALELSAAHPEDLTLYVKAVPKQSGDAAAPVDKQGGAARGSNRYADLECGDGAAGTETDGTRAKAPKPTLKGSDLKERFLETISVDSPASVRNENTSWRLAQKQSHFLRKDVSAGAPSQKKDAGAVKPKVHINLVSALKKGGKGRITLVYGKSMTFKDRTLLRDFEFLDLATGPPVDARRISAKSKRYAMLETIATGGKAKHSSATGQAKAKQATGDGKLGDDGAPPAPGSKKESRSRAPTSNSSAPSTKAAANARRLPSPLAKDIRVTGSLKTAKAGTGQPSITGVLKGDKDARPDSGGRVHFSPALTGKRKAAPVLSNSADVSRMSLEDLLSAVEGQNSTLSTLFLGSVQAEEQFVRTEINLQRELQLAIDNGRLVPVEVLDIPAGSEKQVIAVYHPSGSTRPHVQGNARKQDSRIFMRLVDFDMGVVRASDEFAGMAELDVDELPVRDLMIRSNTCRSLLELGQPHINFGHMEKGDAKTRRILISNRSEWALRYCIRKSGSIASGDIKFSGGRYGVVPGYGKREVEFVFSPSMSGTFQEKLVVENVADRDNDQVVVLKANVRKVSNFAVDPSTIDFGAISPGKLSTPESFVLSNTTSKPRSFVIAIDPHDLLMERCIVDVALSMASDGDVKGTLTREEEEEVEHLSQKLKIASRKGNLDKVKKYEERLSQLGVKPSSPMVASASQAGDEGAEGEQGVEDASTAKALASEASLTTTKLKRISSNVTCALSPNQSKRLVLRVRASAVQSAIRPDQADPAERGGPEKAGVESVEVAVKVHEVKNQDETKVVLLKANVEFELSGEGGGDEGAATSAEAMPSDAVIFSPLA
ncbi:uncharacterized protein PFL1_01315 [Pseudozyma flocculosa PF-1]|nr:uncharacterized protein PFL1_01315 [Pseudozyma flocculosa PF-1]EPQ31126.1 hypothetical protein PFL1_01315 [Pseudozyma flocculosa PF-1]